ncbi:alternative oxidase [Sandaracinus amylolyticus]|uniref:Alternative oxidase n=1 Tax=Sandaracinus amylolyticus TaxID=927083 RepID=A0A0F6W9U2_9BACT|nr:alternative oxidase [Sandaracinus amylolyticus]AKF11061.1 hypothetical protein DB32_008210 [Sandaracinus amylolyticus]
MDTTLERRAEARRDEEARTLRAPRIRHGIAARALFAVMDLVYGRAASLVKFRVLEVIARVPYQAWENVAYVAITHTHRDPDAPSRIFGAVSEHRAQQDNEQWHLLILEELCARLGARESWLLHRAIPQVLAMVYYHLSWLLYVLHPAWSYALNRDFEDHAEREYMAFVAAHPELEREPFASRYEAEYGTYLSVADLLRQIALDEREHKLESEARIPSPRFGLERA